MWLTYILLSGAVLLAILLIIMIFSGLKCDIRADFNNLSVCIKIYLLWDIEIVCFKAFVCEEKFYYQLNKGRLKQLKNDKDEESSSKKRKKNKNKLRLLAYLINLIDKMPKINVKSVDVEYTSDIDDSMKKSLIEGGLLTGGNMLRAVLEDKISVSELRIQEVGGAFKGIGARIIVGASVFKIVFFAIYGALSKRKYRKYA